MLFAFSKLSFDLRALPNGFWVFPIEAVGQAIFQYSSCGTAENGEESINPLTLKMKKFHGLFFPELDML
jgi:hypothetical protein